MVRKYFILFFIVNSRVKNYWNSLYITLFVFACFKAVQYIDASDENMKDEYDSDYDSEDESDDLENLLD